MEAILRSLKQSALFRDIREEEMEAILNCLTYKIKTYEHGRTIELEGNEIQYIGVVLSGHVDMVKEDLWGNHTLLARIGEGELFGETFACGIDSEAVVTFTATGETKVIMLPFQQVMHTCTNECEFHEHMIGNMVQTIAMKNKSLMLKLEIVTKKTLREKILTYLSAQAQMQNRQYFEIPLNRGELAQYLCADRSAMTRELSRMRDEHILDFDGNTFRLY